MGICGLQTQGRLMVNSKSGGCFVTKVGRITIQCALYTILCLMVVSFMGGCATKIVYGSPPKVSQLEKLNIGISTKSDVLATIGEPRGYGVGHYSADTSPREIWFYEYMESDGLRTDLKFLLMFFDAERYDGHLWFSSNNLLDTGE